MSGKQHAKFIHTVHSTSDVVDNLALNMGPGLIQAGNISIKLIFT